MERPVIGIVTPRNIGDNDNPFSHFTRFTNTFPKRIIEAGGCPIGLLFPDGKFDIDEVKLCDGFLFQGGPLIESSQLCTLHYALDRSKPVLGICLGSQTMAGYEWLFKEFNGLLTFNLIESMFKPENEEFFLEKKSNHNNLEPFSLKNINKSKHGIILDKKSRIHGIFGHYISKPSLHNFVINNEILKDNCVYKVTGMSDDGVIEVLESVDPNLWHVGVQFHPEMEDDNLVLFETFVNECSKIKKLK